MSHQVFANNMEVSCKASSGKTICNTPDVCFTPPLTPATPPGVPVPYPNTGMASDTSEGSATVKISGQEIMLKNKSCFSRSSGDEAGCAPKKGVITSTNMGKVYFNAWSMDVKVEGENVPRNLDITTNNHMSRMPGNTPPMPHMSSMAFGMGPPKCEACAAAARVGNPVNPLKGAKLLDGPEDLDFILEGPLELAWQRVYMSNLARVGSFGQGWTTPVEMCLTVARRSIVFMDRDGREIPFPPMAVGEAYFHRQEMSTLERVSPDTYRMRQSDGLLLTFRTGDAGNALSVPAFLSSMSDRNGNAIRFQRSGQGELLRIDGSGEDALLFEWSGGRVARILKVRRDAAEVERGLRCVVAMYEYADGDLVSVITRGGRRTREFAWKGHLMVKHAWPGGLACFYEWTEHTPAGKVLRSWTSTGSELRFDYLPFRTVVTDQDGAVESYSADQDGHWIGYTDARGGQYRRVIDQDGHLVGVVTPSGNATRTEIDERGLPVRFWDESGSVAETSWHPVLDLPVEEKDFLGRTERYAYDARGNMVSHTSADGAQTLFEYDDRGLVVAITDALGKRGVIAYDGSARVTQVTDCTGSSERFDYDEHGQLTAYTDAVGNRTRCTYSVEGDLVAVTAPDGAVTRYEYDRLGRLIRETEPMGGSTAYRLRADGMLMELVEADGQRTRYTRDSVGRLLRIDNPNGASLSISYDASGSIATMKTFEGTEHAYAYSADGLLVGSEETATNGQKIRTTYAYDRVGQLTRVATSDGDWAEFDYDSAGQLVCGRNGQVLVTIRYDEAGRRVSESISRLDSPPAAGAAKDAPSATPSPSARWQRRFSYAYDANGNVVHTSIPGIMELSFLRYGSGYTHQIAVDGIPYCDIERDAEHMAVSLAQGGLVSHLRYDGAWRLSAVDCVPAAPGQAAGEGMQPLISRFAYDRNGDLLAADHRGPWGVDVREFRYDASRRVVEEIGRRGARRTIHWDGASNPVDTPGTKAEDNKLRSFGGMAAEYDGFGRLSERSTASGRMRLSWNSMHQLVGAAVSRDGEAYQEEYVYDAFGRRVAKVSNGQEVKFLWEGERLLMEETGQQRRVFLYHDEDREPLGYALAAAPGAPPDGHRFFYTHNESFGSPFALTDQEGKVMWRIGLDAFGPEAGDAGRASRRRQDDILPGAMPAALVQPLRMLGQYFDATTELCYNRFRYYDPLVGRFISPDPIGLLGGENTYQYAPNVFSWTDPLGLKQIQNAVDGARREAAEAKAAVRGKPHLRVERECYLRSCITGKRMRDPTTKEYRRLDIVVIDKNRHSVTRAIEVTSMTAPKAEQIAKERRIRNRGGQCIRDRETGTLKRVPRVSTVVRRK
jgi:RHS repeat-associated protein